MQNAASNTENIRDDEFFSEMEDFLNEDEEEFIDPEDEVFVFEDTPLPAPLARKLDTLKIGKQFVRFSAVSFSAFMLDFILLFLLTSGFGMHYLVSNIFSFTISIVYSYFLSMRFVYTRRENMNTAEEVILFFILSFFGLALNEFMMWGFKGLGGIPYLYSKILAGALGSLWNFWSRKTFLDSERWHGGSEPRPSLTDAVKKHTHSE